MKKNKLFTFLSIITIIFVFTVAATCNLCGAPITIGETEVTDEEAKRDLEGKEKSDKQDTDEEHQSEQTGEVDQETAEEAQDIEEGQDGNNPPKISVIEWGDSGDIENMEFLNEIPVAPAPCSGIYDAGVPMSITATDEDSDELIYNVNDNRGSSFNVTKIDNNNAKFYWLIPFDAGPYTLTIEVSDSRGGVDSRSVDMTLIPLPNSPPELGSINIANINTGETYPAIESHSYTINGGYKYSLEVDAIDPDCDTLSFTWTITDGSSSNHPSYVWIAPAPSENMILPPHTITVTVDDGRGGTATKSGVVSFEQNINLE
jgi:hypothetical protein